MGEKAPGTEQKVNKKMAKELDREEWLEGAIDAIGEHLGETICQHRSETAMFGDSWPGAQIEISRMHERLRELEQELNDVRSGVLFYSTGV